MQNAAGNATHTAVLDQTYRSVVSDLMSLIEHVQMAIRQVEQALAREDSLEVGLEGGLADAQAQDDIVVLDDVTPGYVRADAALNACSAKLDAALHVLIN
jgi:hypothetical protein